MTRIRATCPDCGEVDLKPADIELRIVRTDVGDVGDGSTYRFSCPACELLVRKPADERVARLLATGGVDVAVDSPEAADPASPVHPEAPRGGPALTYDDLLDLHFRLQDDAWFDELARTVSLG